MVYTGEHLRHRRFFEALLHKLVFHRRTHVFRRQKALCVHVHTALIVRRALRKLRQLIKAVLIAELMPHILQHPKAHDVFQIPIAVLIPALVRKILRTALVVRHRRFQLHANEAPRAARKEHRVLILRRHRQKRGSRVVRSRKPHRQIKTDLLLHALRQPAERFTRLVQLAEDFLR